MRENEQRISCITAFLHGHRLIVRQRKINLLKINCAGYYTNIGLSIYTYFALMICFYLKNTFNPDSIQFWALIIICLLRSLKIAFQFNSF